MAVIYLVHSVHGAKVAISEEEAVYDAISGWQRYDINTSTVLVDDNGDDEPVGERVEPKRRGRPRARQES